MKKSKLVITALIASFLFVTGCSGADKASTTKEEDKVEKKEAKEKGTKTTDRKEEKAKDKAGSGKILNPYIAEESQGDVKVLYTNKDPKYSHEMNGFKVTISEYQLVKVDGVHRDYETKFKGPNGYIVTARATIENTTKKDLYYNNIYGIRLRDVYEYITSDWKTLVKEDDQFPRKKKGETGKYAAGEKATGLVNFFISEERFNIMKTISPKFVIEAGVADNPEFKDSYKIEGVFDFLYSDEQAEKIAKGPKFFPDKLTTDNIAEKKMIFEKLGMKDTKEIDKVKITVKGVQYTEIIPTEISKPSFKNFGDKGIVALTVQLFVDNQSDQFINFGSSIVRLDENRGYVLSQGMVEPKGEKELEAGKQGEFYQVYLFRKDDFESIKKFELEFGPLRGKDYKDLFKGHIAKFQLPR